MGAHWGVHASHSHRPAFVDWALSPDHDSKLATVALAMPWPELPLQEKAIERTREQTYTLLKAYSFFNFDTQFLSSK